MQFAVFLRNMGKTRKTTFKFLRMHYLWDALFLVLVTVLAFVLNAGVDPHEMYLPSPGTNPDVNYPYQKSETFPTYSLYICMAVILVALVVWPFLRRARSKAFNPWIECFNAVLSFCESVAFQNLSVKVFKIFAGRYRPHYMQRRLISGSAERSSRRSFPSGHSSFAFSMFFWATLYLAGKLHLFSGTSGTALAFVVSVLPSFFGSIVAVSRTRDYYHHFEDILAGMLLGALTAIIAYFNMFPALTSELSHLSKNAILIDRQNAKSGAHKRGDEDTALLEKV